MEGWRVSLLCNRKGQQEKGQETMEVIITDKTLAEFHQYLVNGEKSRATQQKYEREIDFPTTIRNMRESTCTSAGFPRSGFT